MRFFKCSGFHDKIEKRIIFSGWGGEVRGGVVTNKSSLSFGRTSAGIVCCFGGMFDTIRGSRKIKIRNSIHEGNLAKEN